MTEMSSPEVTIDPFIIDPLTEDNYYTWKIHAQALLVKSDYWCYVDGSSLKPEPSDTNAAEIQMWEAADQKAKAELILSISPSQLGQIKDCKTARELWLKLESINQSKAPARKISLLNKLILSKMMEKDDAQEHLEQFFYAARQLDEMNMKIDDDVLVMLLLYSLPASYENFRCAIEARDDLPTPAALGGKILAEAKLRRRREDHRNAKKALQTTNN